jgi:predicted metal-dependent peptidase
MIEPEVNIGVVIDTSGSMGTNELNEAMAEVSGIIRSCGTKIGVNVIACDAAAEDAQRVFSASQIKLSGGGGTDMRVGIEAAQDARPRPDIIVVLSDGMTPWPDAPIREKLIIGIVGGYDVAGCPEWAKTIKIGDE